MTRWINPLDIGATGLSWQAVSGRGHDFRCIIEEWGRLDESIGKMGDPEEDIQVDNLVE